MLPYSHYTAAVKIPSKHPIGFVSRRRQQGLPMSVLDNDTLHNSAHFYITLLLTHVAPLYITFYLLLVRDKRLVNRVSFSSIKCSKIILSLHHLKINQMQKNEANLLQKTHLITIPALILIAYTL